MRFLVERLLGKADIRVNGDRPWDIKVHDERVFGEVLRRGSLGLGESYMRGWWDCADLEEFFRRLLSAHVDWFGLFNPVAAWRYLLDRFSNPAAHNRSFETGEVHYSLGNDLFSKMLDRGMNYSCAYVPASRSTLEDAQLRKLDLVCRKLKLEKEQYVLDIGCGWGAFAKFATENYGVIVKGVTISDEQANYARENCRSLPVRIAVEDYRDCVGSFDRIVSLGMFEHVEYQNYDSYFACIKRCLKPGGIFLLHTIGKEGGGTTSDAFTRKYIFPQGMIPGRERLRRTIEKQFCILDWHTFGSWHYEWTLRAWHENFSRAWPELKEKYGPRLGGKFERMWRYYLLSCAGAFSADRLDVWQIVISKTPIHDYQAER